MASYNLLQPEIDKWKNQLASLSTAERTSNKMKYKIESELRMTFIKIRNKNEESIPKKILSLVMKDDSVERIIGLLAVKAYSKILNENEILSFVNDTLQSVSQKVFLSNDENLIELGVEVYGTLVGLGGINIASQIEDNVSSCISNLGRNEKRYSSLLMLLELLRHAQFITFNKIKKYRYTDLFKTIVAEKKPNYRKKGLDLIDECIKEISKRDRQEQANMLTRIFTDIFKERQAKAPDAEVNSAVGVVIKSLLTYANKEVFDESSFSSICEFNNSLKTSRVYPNQIIVIEIYPVLASYNPDFFSQQTPGYLDKALEHLLKLLQPQNQNMTLKKASHHSLSKIFDPYHPEKIKDRAKLVLDVLFDEFKNQGNKLESTLLSCMVAVSEKCHKYFSSFFPESQIQELVNLLLLNGINEDILQFLEFLVKINLPEVTFLIQVKLLSTIWFILTNVSNPFANSLDPQVEKYYQSIREFQYNLEKTLKSSSKDGDNENLVCVSLSCLSRFKFPQFRDKMGFFVKEVALVFLDDLRPQIRKAAAKAVTLVNPSVESLESIGLTHSMMYQILNKLLYIAISDPDDEVREVMLSSLNKNFNNYLKNNSSLHSLILALNDSNDKVQRRAIIILRRIMASNAAEIVPALQNSLFRIIRVINMKTTDNEREIVQNLNLLKCFINHAPFLLKNQKDMIFKFLLNILQNQKVTQLVSAEIFSTLSSLVCISKTGTIKYFDQLMQVTLDSFEDMAFTVKRTEAIKCLSNIIRTSGLVVFVNYKYPNLSELVFMLFQVEANPDTRLELMRLIGVLGAVDFFNLFKLQSEGHITNLSHPDLMKIIEGNHKGKFYFENLVLNWKFPEDPCEVQLKTFFKNIINLNHILDKSIGDDTLTQVIELHELGTNRKGMTNIKQILGTETGIRDESIKELLQFRDPINLSDIESLLAYITNVTLKTLLFHLYDMSLVVNHKYIVDDLNLIVYTIGKEISPYLHILVPCLSHYVHHFKDTNLNHDILQLFENFLKACGSKFGSESMRNIDMLIEIILMNLNDGKCKEKCLVTLIELINTNKSMMKFKMQTICMQLVNLLLAGNESPSVIEKIFLILKLAKDHSESFLHILLPHFCRILINSKPTDSPVLLKGVIDYIKSTLDFDSTLQYTSNIVHSLIKCLSEKDEVIQECRDCIIALIGNFKEHALIYLPLINSAFNQRNLRNDPKLKAVTEKLKECGDLEDIELIDDNTRKMITNDSMNTLSNPMGMSHGPNKDNGLKLNDAIKQFNSENVKNLFDVSSNFLKEDWEEWLTKTSNELLTNSPSKVLFCCKSFANVNPNISKDLFNIGFAMIWSQFNDNQKCAVIQNIEKTIANQNVPLSVHKVILNLAEFMEHDNQGLQLDITYMARLAERCNAHAKALYYREFEFNFSPDDCIESLIALYSSLGQPEAASGMLEFAKNILQTKVKESWLEALGEWEEALVGYSREKPSSNTEILGNLKAKVRCYDALTNWEKVIEAADEYLVPTKEQTDIASYAARAAIQLGQWDKLEKYTEKINSRKDDINYYEAIISISKNQFKEARTSIKKSRRFFENFLVGLNKQSYQNNYDKLVKLQILSEMEEIIAFKEFQNSLSGDQTTDAYNNETDVIENPYEAKKNALMQLWSDRIEGVEKNMNYWNDIISVRSLLFKKGEMMHIMLRFGHLAIEKGKIALSQRIFSELEDELTKIGELTASAQLSPTSVDNLPSYESNSSGFSKELDLCSRIRYELPPEFYLSKFEKMYKLGEIDEEQVYEYIQDFFQSTIVPENIKATYSFKLGSWLSQKNTDISSKNYERCYDLFNKALTTDDRNVSTWHLFALLNYKRVMQVAGEKENRQVGDDKELESLVTDAFKGLLKTILLGGFEFTETLQDTLRLIELWFKFGDIPSVKELLYSTYKEIDLSCWLAVVPQIITRLDVPSEGIVEDVLEVLEYVGNKYPQGLIFQLTLAAQTKGESRRKSAARLIKVLTNSHPEFVNEADIISKELQKVAILPEEEWIESIDEVLKFQAEGKSEVVVRLMVELHKKTAEPPTSVHEIYFYQKFGGIIKEAESWLQQFSRRGDPLALSMAVELYLSLLKELEEAQKGLETIHLQNVSPALLKIKDSPVAIPGLYNPKKPQVYISGFHDILELITSKRKPRKLKVFGSDGRAYDFLLKGHEDLRQDERVMQSLALVNSLLRKHQTTEKQDLTIVAYPIIPLSPTTGLGGWVKNCDTLQQLIRDYRHAHHIVKDGERSVMSALCPNYQIAGLPHKVEVFRHVLEVTRGDDLKKVLWLKSETAEVWLDRRTNYERSLATMSMVGYILGLGDRHLSNLMLQRATGKIVHIDFGDLFEVTMTRDRFPERVPFRLTRVLTKAMEACGIEGNYKATCERVMAVLRENKDSLLAILEAFVTDPLLNWRLVAPVLTTHGGPVIDGGQNSPKGVNPELSPQFAQRGYEEFERNKGNSTDIEELQKEADMINTKAHAAVNRIKAKLMGNDFKNHTELSVSAQVNLLIRQATSHENICQAWLGWNPFL